MKLKKVMVGILLAGLTATGAFADTKLSSRTTIKKIYNYSSGVVLELSTPMAKNQGCTYSKSGRYVALRHNETSKELYSTLLSAYVANLKVQIGTRNCDDIWSSVGTMNKVYKVVLSR